VTPRRAIALLVLPVLVVACGEHRVQPPVTTPAAPAAGLVISEDSGARVRKTERVAPGQTVMAALQGVADVSTRYGGRFVQSIDGTAGSLDRGEDWLYFVNGVEADVGAADWKLRDGDTAWWDYRRWHLYPNVPAVVGSWPEPFVHGARSTPTAVAADPPLDQALRAAGAPIADGAAPYRVLVGADRDLRARDADWRRAEDSPRTSGLTAWIHGSAVFRFDAEGNDNVAVPEGKAVAAATRTADGGVVLAVTGVDAASAQAAAAAIAKDPALLAHRYAVVFDGAGTAIAYGGAG
jgi:Domain of unknown function (DUF4430)